MEKTDRMHFSQNNNILHDSLKSPIGFFGTTLVCFRSTQVNVTWSVYMNRHMAHIISRIIIGVECFCMKKKTVMTRLAGTQVTTLSLWYTVSLIRTKEICKKSFICYSYIIQFSSWPLSCKKASVKFQDVIDMTSIQHWTWPQSFWKLFFFE